MYNYAEIDNIPNEDLQFVISDQLFLDTLLMEIRGESISYGSFKNKERNNRENNLRNQISELENSTEDSNIEQLEILKTELCDIRHDKLKCSLIRSKCIDQGEKPTKPTKYFCGLEKHNFTSKIIGQIEKEDGSMIVNQTDILKDTENYNKKLYENKDDLLDNVDLKEYMKDIDMTKLTNQESEKLEGLLTYREISEVLFKMKPDKSPGITGFTAEFFKVLWKQIGHFVLRYNVYKLWI